MHLTIRLFAGLIALAGSTLSVSAASPYQAGDAFEGFTTMDQHEKGYTYSGGVRLVIVAFVMGTGKSANAYFEKQPADFLERHKAIFISNIYGMPGIGRTFALPKMRKYPHRILLADAEGFLARYPSQEDRLTVLRLDDQGKVAEINFVDPKKEMASIFAAAK